MVASKKTAVQNMVAKHRCKIGGGREIKALEVKTSGALFLAKHDDYFNLMGTSLLMEKIKRFLNL